MYLRSLHDIFSLLLLRIPRLLILRCSTTFSMVGSSYLLLTLQYWVFPIQHNPGKKDTPESRRAPFEGGKARFAVNIDVY